MTRTESRSALAIQADRKQDEQDRIDLARARKDYADIRAEACEATGRSARDFDAEARAIVERRKENGCGEPARDWPIAALFVSLGWQAA